MKNTRSPIQNKHNETHFSEIIQLITAAQSRAYQSVNTILIDLYWQIGKYISDKIGNAEWGDGVVEQLAA